MMCLAIKWDQVEIPLHCVPLRMPAQTPYHHFGTFGPEYCARVRLGSQLFQLGLHYPRIQHQNVMLFLKMQYRLWESFTPKVECLSSRGRTQQM